MQSDKTGAEIIQNIKDEIHSMLEEVQRLVRQAEFLDNRNASVAELICFHLEEASKDLVRGSELATRLTVQTV